ncbi:hypothetical protein BDV98DRAFT_578441 [Pterulicium gracile]|uniref:Uncharacterized protein n=1 Tax=Pterulicium gracile TaxID=1884261 RepID=A0A5C3PYX6_9AGAR|nr:hypothetical protein BDV98DRAFT_578441 [Pterula gracilis]
MSRSPESIPYPVCTIPFSRDARATRPRLFLILSLFPRLDARMFVLPLVPEHTYARRYLAIDCSVLYSRSSASCTLPST